jgi:hypothetical protein
LIRKFALALLALGLLSIPAHAQTTTTYTSTSVQAVGRGSGNDWSTGVPLKFGDATLFYLTLQLYPYYRVGCYMPPGDGAGDFSATVPGFNYSGCIDVSSVNVGPYVGKDSTGRCPATQTISYKFAGTDANNNPFSGSGALLISFYWGGYGRSAGCFEDVNPGSTFTITHF